MRQKKLWLVIFIFNLQETKIWNICYERKHNQSVYTFVEKLLSIENRVPINILKKKIINKEHCLA